MACLVGCGVLWLLLLLLGNLWRSGLLRTVSVPRCPFQLCLVVIKWGVALAGYAFVFAKRRALELVSGVFAVEQGRGWFGVWLCCL